MSNTKKPAAVEVAKKYTETAANEAAKLPVKDKPHTDKAIAIKDTLPVFKSEALNSETRTIYDTANAVNSTVAEARRTIAVSLYTIESGKLYKDDGYKSLAEYAETIGLDKSLAHKLENAGRMIKSDNDTIKEFSAKADWSKLAILASADPKEVEEAIKGGDLTPETTQAEVKEWKAKKSSKSKDTEVLTSYNWSIAVYSKEGRMQVDVSNTPEEAVELFEGVAWGVIKTSDGHKVKVGLTKEGDMLRIISKERAIKHDTQRRAGAPEFDVSTMSDEFLAAVMAEIAKRKGEEA